MLNFRLLGRSYQKIQVGEEEETVYMAEKEVKNQFGNRPIFIPKQCSNNLYPKMYAAGWAISNECIDGSEGGSELVVIAHGETMKTANENMILTITNIDWKKHARDL
jgi:hypothetical protein